MDIPPNSSLLEAAQSYALKAWVLGKSPKYTLRHNRLDLTVEKGKITSINEGSLSYLIGQWHSLDVLQGAIEDDELLRSLF